MIDISKKSKAAVLAALYNSAHPLGLGWLHYTPTPMTEAEAKAYLDNNNDHYIDYLNGRVMKVDLSGDSFNPARYDHDNGEGAAQRAVDSCPDII